MVPIAKRAPGGAAGEVGSQPALLRRPLRAGGSAVRVEDDDVQSRERGRDCGDDQAATGFGASSSSAI